MSLFMYMDLDFEFLDSLSDRYYVLKGQTFIFVNLALAEDLGFDKRSACLRSLNKGALARAPLRRMFGLRTRFPSAEGAFSLTKEDIDNRNGRPQRYLISVFPMIDEHRLILSRLVTTTSMAARSHYQLDCDYRELLDHAPIGIYKTKWHGPVTYANREILHNLRFRSEEEARHFVATEGQTIYAEPRIRRLFERELLRRGRVENLVIQTSRQFDSKPLWITERAISKRDSAGRPDYYFGYTLDISSQMAAEEALRVAMGRASDAQRARAQFITSVVHDLRQPIAVLESLSSDLSNATNPEDRKTLARQLHDHTNRLHAMMDSLITIGQLETGQLSSEPEPFAIRRLLLRLRSDYADLAAARGLEIEVRSSKDLVLADPMLVERICRNILDNAVRYATRGPIRFSATRCRGGKAVMIRLSDMGPGLNTNRKEAFRLAQQGATWHSRKPGHGFGLGVVARLAEMAGVKIELRSSIGQGTSFAFSVPRAASAQNAAASTNREEARNHSLQRLVGRTIMLLNHEVAVLEQLKRTFMECGALVVTSSYPTDLIERIRSGPFHADALVLSYHLNEEKTGTEVATRLAQILNRSLPTVVMSNDRHLPHRLNSLKNLIFVNKRHLEKIPEILAQLL